MTGLDGTGALPSGNDSSRLEEARGWNWGAFCFSWIWALGNRLYTVALLALLPQVLGLGIIAMVVLGFDGNRLAWKHRPFRDFEEFRGVRRRWNQAGLVAVVIGLCMVGLVVLNYWLRY